MVIPRAVLHGACVSIHLHGAIGVGEPDPGILHAGEFDKGESSRITTLPVLGDPHILKAGPTGCKGGTQLHVGRRRRRSGGERGEG